MYPTNDKRHSTNTAIILHQLGLVAYKLNKFQQAEDFFHQSLKELTDIGEINSPITAKILFDEADTLWQLKDWLRWFQTQSRARDIWQNR